MVTLVKLACRGRKPARQMPLNKHCKGFYLNTVIQIPLTIVF
jgi:hypothetical protein